MTSAHETVPTVPAPHIIAAPVRLHVGNKAEFKLTLLDALVEHPAVVVDCSAMEWLDAAGIGVLLYTRRYAAKAGARLVIAALRPEVLELFQLCKLDTVLELAPSVGAAWSLPTPAREVAHA